MPQSCLLEVLCLCDFFILLCFCLPHPSARGWPFWGNWCSNPASWVCDGIVPQCDRSAGRCCLYHFQKRIKVRISLPPSTLSLPSIQQSPGGTVCAFKHPMFPWLLAGLKGTGLLLHLYNKSLVCALYCCCQLLSINIYRFCYTASSMCVVVYRGKNCK